VIKLTQVGLFVGFFFSVSWQFILFQKSRGDVWPWSKDCPLGKGGEQVGPTSPFLFY